MEKPDQRQNPFRFGQVVEDEAYCPRSDLERSLGGRIQRGQNTAVLGQRRVGKTSLVWKVAHSRRSWKVWYVDCLGIKTSQDFLTRGVQALSALGTGDMSISIGGKLPIHDGLFCYLNKEDMLSPGKCIILFCDFHNPWH